jgi:MFS family permease
MKKNVLEFSKDVRDKDPKAVYYLVTFLTDFAIGLVATIYTLFLLSKGLDLLQANLVNLAFMLGNFVFEIPTGAYADFFGRRKSLILSNLFLIASFFIYFISADIFVFILAELLAAIAITFASGALDAWAVDSLKEKGYIGKMDFIFSQASIIGSSAALLGGLIGAYIGTINLALPWAFGGILSIVSLVAVLLFMHEKPIKRELSLSFINGLNQLMITSKDSINFGLRHKVVLWLIFSSMISLFAFQPLNMYWSPRLSALAGNQVWILGWVWVGVTLSMMLGSFLVKKLLKREKSYLSVFTITVLFLAVPTLLASMFDIFAVVLSGFLVYEIGRGMLKPVHKSYLNLHIPSEKRATILSFDSMMGKLGAAGGLVILGFIANKYSIAYSWLAGGILLLFLIPVYLKAAQNETKHLPPTENEAKPLSFGN